jgi:hypothetical protein
MSSIFILFAIVSLLAIAALVVLIFKKRQDTHITPLTALAFAFILAGIFFGSEGWIGYALMGVGVILAFGDIVRRSRRM